jgi:phage baseplate assembly protein V
MASELETSADLRDVVRKGRVLSRDLSARTCVVEFGELLLPGVRWASVRMGAFRIWSPPSEGEQVIVLSPEGDSAQAVIVASLTSNAHPAPSDEDALVIAADDGSVISYALASHALTVALCAGGKVIMAAPGGFELTGDVAITGDLSVTGGATIGGDVEADGDVKAGPISLRNHKTTGVKAGLDLSGDPQ